MKAWCSPNSMLFPLFSSFAFFWAKMPACTIHTIPNETFLQSPILVSTGTIGPSTSGEVAAVAAQFKSQDRPLQSPALAFFFGEIPEIGVEISRIVRYIRCSRTPKHPKHPKSWHPMSVLASDGTSMSWCSHVLHCHVTMSPPWNSLVTSIPPFPRRRIWFYRWRLLWQRLLWHHESPWNWTSMIIPWLITQYISTTCP